MKNLVNQFLKERQDGANITPEGKLRADVLAPAVKQNLFDAGVTIKNNDPKLFQMLTQDNDQGTEPDLVPAFVGNKQSQAGAKVFLQDKHVANVNSETKQVQRVQEALFNIADLKRRAEIIRKDQDLVSKFLQEAYGDEKDQSYMIDVFAGSLKKAPIYKKFKQVKANKRPAIGGEIVVTITEDGVETKNIAKPGDIIVQNMTGAQECYILKPEVFKKRYKPSSDKYKSNWYDLYDPIGECKGIEYSGHWVEKFGSEFRFDAPWGEKMVCKEGDMLVTPDVDGDIKEIYRIARKEFEETYKEK